MWRKGTFLTNGIPKPNRHGPRWESVVCALAFWALGSVNLGACSFKLERRPWGLPGMVNFEDFKPDRDNPFVIGSVTTWTVFRPASNLNGWTLEASNPNVLKLSSSRYLGDFDRLWVDCEALALGTWRMRVVFLC